MVFSKSAPCSETCIALHCRVCAQNSSLRDSAIRTWLGRSAEPFVLFNVQWTAVAFLVCKRKLTEFLGPTIMCFYNAGPCRHPGLSRISWFVVLWTSSFLCTRQSPSKDTNFKSFSQLFFCSWIEFAHRCSPLLFLSSFIRRALCRIYCKGRIWGQCILQSESFQFNTPGGSDQDKGRRTPTFCRVWSPAVDGGQSLCSPRAAVGPAQLSAGHAVVGGQRPQTGHKNWFSLRMEKVLEEISPDSKLVPIDRKSYYHIVRKSIERSYR